MLIQLTDSDLARMTPALRGDFLNWIESGSVTEMSQEHKAANLVLLDVEPYNNSAVVSNFPTMSEAQYESQRLQIRLSQLFDEGLTKPGMPIRIRLKRDRAKEIGRNYLNNLVISSKGTVVYENEEFDKPSPLATKLNGSPANGWEYIEIKREGKWVRLEVLRQQVRQTT